MNKKREQKEMEKLKRLKVEDTDIGQVFRVLDNGRRFEAKFFSGWKSSLPLTYRVPVDQMLTVSIMPGDIVSVHRYEPQIYKYSYDEARLLKKIGELPQHITLNE